MTSPPVTLTRIDDVRVRVERRGAMHTEGLIFADERLMGRVEGDASPSQVANVATLPGIVGKAMAMPDIHWGYGFPIGGVAAFDMDEGVISPGGVGYDINCGVRLLGTALDEEAVRPRLEALVAGLMAAVPSGVGSRRKDLRVTAKEMARVAEQGARWAVSQGFGAEADLDHIEDGGTIPHASLAAVSSRAVERGSSQLGTLGSGNHFIEIGIVDEVLDDTAAEAMGLRLGQVTVSVHTGSRGFGYQVCDDSLRAMAKASRKYGIELADRQLVAAPLSSPEGKEYMASMAAAANFAFANRQIIDHWIRETFGSVLGMGPRDLAMGLVYDVAHNIAKIETHRVDGEARTVCVHRKGATRALPAGHPLVPPAYRHIGQPVLVPGDMGRASYVLVGLPGALEETFGSCCHGAGRLLSRKASVKRHRKARVGAALAAQGVVVMAAGRQTLLEEAPGAYKDVTEVVDVVARAGIARPVVKLRPIGVVKG